MIIESKDGTLVIKFGKQTKNDLNIFVNFKGYEFADIIEKLDYAKVIRVMAVEKPNYGLHVQFTKPNMHERFIEDLPNCLYDYECKRKVG